MPFNEDFDDVYKAGIKPACENAGAYCERVDEQQYEGRILDRIYNQIGKADVIVADMTGQNSNVFYEVGYAHALDKRVILLTEDVEHIPFDLSQFLHIVYEGEIHKLKENLRERVEWMLGKKDEDQNAGGIGMEPFIDGSQISNNPTVVAKKTTPSISDSRVIKFDIQNQSKEITRSDEYRVGVITPSYVNVRNAERSTPQPNGTILNFLKNEDRPVFPGDWVSYNIDFTHTDEIEDGDKVDFKVRLFSGISPRDYKFTVKVRDTFDIDMGF
jgi:hypothetical protein